MKRTVTLATITGTAAAGLVGLALLAAWSFKTVQATTFPSLTLIYTAAGVRDFDSTTRFGTSISCVNQSGQSASVRWRFLDEVGIEVGTRTLTVPGGQARTVGTSNGTFFYSDIAADAASNFQGRVAIYSTESAVFCSSVVANSEVTEPGYPLHMVRFNAHPGTIE